MSSENELADAVSVDEADQAVEAAETPVELAQEDAAVPADDGESDEDEDGDEDGDEDEDDSDEDAA